MSDVAPSKSWIFYSIVVVVIAAHLAALQCISIVLKTQTTQASSLTGTSFDTRTIEIQAPPPTTLPPSTPTEKRKRAIPKPSAANIATSPLQEAIGETQNLSDSAISNNEPSYTDTTHLPQIAPTPETTPKSAPTEALPPTRYAIPSPAILKYDIKGEIKGFAYFASGQLSWQHNGSNYDAQLEISHFLLGSRTQTSSGQITAHGLEPLRFADKARTEVAALLDHSQKQVTFTADGAHTKLEDDAQDQLSIFLQLSSLLAGNPEHYKAGDRLAFQAVGAKSSEQWTFEVGPLESLTLPGGTVQALRLTRNPPTDSAPKVEVWLAPKMQFLPVRIRLMQGDGDFVEQQWRSIKKPL